MKLESAMKWKKKKGRNIWIVFWVLLFFWIWLDFFFYSTRFANIMIVKDGAIKHWKYLWMKTQKLSVIDYLDDHLFRWGRFKCMRNMQQSNNWLTFDVNLCSHQIMSFHNLSWNFNNNKYSNQQCWCFVNF